MPLFKVKHNDEEIYVFADYLTQAIKNWAMAEAKREGEDGDPNGYEPDSVEFVADDDHIVAHNENDEPSYADNVP